MTILSFLDDELEGKFIMKEACGKVLMIHTLSLNWYRLTNLQSSSHKTLVSFFLLLEKETAYQVYSSVPSISDSFLEKVILCL
jgi:hypothetical protein